jgi:hypothetical protein
MSVPSFADAIYSNTSNDLSTRFDTGTAEVGDEVTLESTGFLTSFSLEYWAENSASSSAFAGNVEARVRLYRNNGELVSGYASPSDFIYDSGWFSLGAPTSRSTINFAAGVDWSPSGLFIADNNITWSIQFQGLGSTDSAGLDVFNPPTVGSSYDDYWWRDPGTGEWSLLQDGSGIPMNFAARFEATIPEPSSLSLVLLGGLGAVWMRRNRK